MKVGRTNKYDITMSTTQLTVWSERKKNTLKFFTLLFALSVIPLFDKNFYSLFSSSEKNSFDWAVLVSYYPRIFADGAAFGLYSYLDFLLVLLASAIGVVVWNKTLIPRPTDDYDKLYYWVRVVVRYKLAAILIGFGLLKVFVLQIPYPSLSNLHTNYGDFLPWKIYYHTIGIVQGYEVFLGVVEVAAGLLLLVRKTVTFSTGIILGFAGNVFMANIAYQIGDHVLLTWVLVYAGFLFAHDVPRLYHLLFLQRKVLGSRFRPDFSNEKLRKARIALKFAFAALLMGLVVKSYSSYANDPYLIPKEEGLKDTYGYYNVREFIFNNDTIPYSQDDPDRWQNVVFEKWATISIKIARPVQVDDDLYHQLATEKDVRRYESAGVGDRHYFSYTADSTSHTLQLQNKNKYHEGEQYTLNYSRSGESIVLSGVDIQGNTIRATLDKINRKYMLIEGRRRQIKL